ncbi:hypothetical protein AN958_10107 [Leucoagaricus sp. SymC.cos]|nr:hypothetical protein AN958_10107 [Leucoagaricus sp. SymC.cos]
MFLIYSRRIDREYSLQFKELFLLASPSVHGLVVSSCQKRATATLSSSQASHYFMFAQSYTWFSSALNRGYRLKIQQTPLRETF